MKPIKILHIIHDFLNGGIESLVYYLTQVQRNNSNLEVAILCCQKKELVTNKRIIEAKIKCHFVEIKPWDLRITQYNKIIKIANKYDILHIHTFKPFLAYAFICSNAKLLYTNHSAGEEGRESTLAIKIKTFLLKIYLNRCVHFITNNSEYTKNFWIGIKDVTNKNNRVVYNGVYFNHANKSGEDNIYDQTKDKFIVGTSSRFIKWKRVEKLITAFSSFQKGKEDALLLLVGDGPEKKNLYQLSKKLGLTKNIIFTGYKTNVTEYQSVMDVCVFPSNCEPFGLVAIECMYLGKAVIVFKDGGGITEIIKNIEPDNIVESVDDLVDKLEYYYHNTALLQKPSQINKRIRYAKKFDIKKTEQNFFDIYKKMVKPI